MVSGFRNFEANGDKTLVERNFFDISDVNLGEDRNFEHFMKEFILFSHTSTY